MMCAARETGCPSASELWLLDGGEKTALVLVPVCSNHGRQQRSRGQVVRQIRSRARA